MPHEKGEVLEAPEIKDDDHEAFEMVVLGVHVARAIEAGWSWDLESDCPKWFMIFYMKNIEQCVSMSEKLAAKLMEACNCCEASKAWASSVKPTYDKKIERPDGMFPDPKGSPLTSRRLQ
jgi:hypothetical protein